jgi:hypothetical protein
LRPIWANSLWDPILKITRVKCTGGIDQAVEHLLCKHEALSSNSSFNKEKIYGKANCLRIRNTTLKSNIFGTVTLLTEKSIEVTIVS